MSENRRNPNKFKELANKFKELAKDLAEGEYSEFKETKWIVEFAKIFITALVTSIILYVIRTNSKGELDGTELKEYLTNLTCNAIGISYDINNIDFNILFDCTSDTVLSDKKTLVASGSYKTTKQTEEKFCGRFIALFERKKGGFFNSFIGITPQYEIKFLRILESEGMLDDVFFYKDHFEEDIDGDGILDLILFFQTNYATRSGEVAIMLTKIDNEWTVVDFPYDSIFELTSGDYFYTSDNNSFYLSIEEIYLYNPLEINCKDTVYYISRGSDIHFVINPIENNICFLIHIAAQGYQEGAALPGQCVYICLDYNKGVMRINEQWNRGKPFVVKNEDIKSFDYSDYSDYWGVMIDGLFFY